jgi:hypothetical protein
MALSRAQLLNELMPSLDKLFSEEYGKYEVVLSTSAFTSYFIRKNKEDKYQVWECGLSPDKLVADNIEHRREAIALIKLLQSTQGE